PQGQSSTPIRIAISAGLVRTATTVAARDSLRHSDASASRAPAPAGTGLVPVLPSDSMTPEGSGAEAEVQPLARRQMRGMPSTMCGAAETSPSRVSEAAGGAGVASRNSSSPRHFGQAPRMRSPSAIAGVFQVNAQLVQRTAYSSAIRRGIGA